MIMAANIGIRISGQEGLQAVSKRLRDCAILILETFTPGSWKILLSPSLCLCCQHVLQEYFGHNFAIRIFVVQCHFLFFPETPGLLFFNAIYTAAAVVFFSIFDEDLPSFYPLRYQSCTDLGQLVVSFRPEFS